MVCLRLLLCLTVGVTLAGPVLATAVTLPLLFLFKQVWMTTSLLAVLLQLVVSLVPFALSAWFLALDPRDRARSRELLGRFAGVARRARGDQGPA